MGSLLLMLAVLPTTANAASTSATANVISAVDVEGHGETRTVRIKTNSTPTFTVFRLDDPMRVVVDISGADVSQLHGPLVFEDGVVGQVAVRQFRSDGFVIGRIIVGFERNCGYDVQTEGHDVVVRTTAVNGSTHVTPPPVAPIDRAAAERAATERRRAEAAAKSAEAEHSAAEAARIKATAEREEASQKATQAQQLAQQAETAKADAERLRAEAVQHAAVERAEVERRAKAAEARVQALQNQADALRQEQAASTARAEALEAKERATEASAAEAVRVARQQAANAAAAEVAKLRESQAAESQRAQSAYRAREEALLRALAASKQTTQPADEAQEERATSPSLLTGVQKGRDDSFLLRVRGAAPFHVERLTDPPRLVVDLVGAQRQTRRTQYHFRGRVGRVRLGDQPNGVRAVFDLQDSRVQGSVATVPSGVRVSLSEVASEPADNATVTGATTASLPQGEAAASADTAGQAADAAAQTEVVDVDAGKALLEAVKIKSDGKGGAHILLKLKGAAQAQVDTASSQTWVLKLDNTALAPSQPRSLDLVDQGGVLTQVALFDNEPGLVQVVASLSGPAESHLRRARGGWMWDVASTAEPELSASAAAPQTAGFVAEATALARSTPTQTRDPRRRISLDVKDADIINVLRLISEETGENIIASDDVKGKVTLKLRNVPAEQALDTVLKTKGFDRVRQNNILRIAPAEAIQKERDLELAKKRSQAEVEETFIKMVTVNYATASEILDQIKPMLTARGSVQVDARTNTLILQDISSNIDRLVELARRLDRQTPLVMIQARIVEATTTHLQDLGVQWGGTVNRNSRFGNPTGLVFPGDVTAAGAGDDPTRNQVAGITTPAHYAVNLPAQLAGAGGGLGFVLGSAGGADILNLRLTAMESNGTGKIISSPEVATLDNKTARVSQGVEIPISVVSAAGTNTRFIPAVLELEVTPHVTNDGTVLLKIKAQKSQPDFTQKGAAGDPTIQKKYAETEVLVRDGDTSVIGGIYTRDVEDTVNELPFLSRIPILGNLFREHRTQDNRGELLVFITPRIINREESMVQQQGNIGGTPDNDAATPQ